MYGKYVTQYTAPPVFMIYLFKLSWATSVPCYQMSTLCTAVYCNVHGNLCMFIMTAQLANSKWKLIISSELI